jgi:hypothetical protein
LRQALHRIVEQPGCFRSRGEAAPHIGAKYVAERMLAGTNGMRQAVPGSPLIVAEHQKRPRPHRTGGIAPQRGTERREAISPSVALVQHTDRRQGAEQAGQRGRVRLGGGAEEGNIARFVTEMVGNFKFGGNVDKPRLPSAGEQAHHGASRLRTRIADRRSGVAALIHPPRSPASLPAVYWKLLGSAAK